MTNLAKSVHLARHARVSFTSCLSASLLLLGCGSDASSGGTSSAKPAGASSATASARPAVVAQPDYCKRSCERAAACGKELALELKNLEPEAKAAIDKSLPDTVHACVEACAAEPATDVRLSLADRCNQEKDCAGFAKCLQDLGAELKKP